MSDTSHDDNPYLQPLTPVTPNPVTPPPIATQPMVEQTLPTAQPMTIETEPARVNYAQLDSTQMQPLPTSSPSMDGQILTVETENPSQHSPTNWFRIGVISAVFFIALGGTGGAFYMIKTTTDSVSKAAKTQQDVINDIIKEADSSFSLVQKVEAGYENPFEPSAEEANPFTDVTNPFDEIGF